MKRRDLLTLFGGVLAATNTARAQPPERVRRVGYLGSAAGSSGTLAREAVSAFRATLKKLGWVEGRNLSILYRWSEGRREQITTNARELAMLRPDVVVTFGGPATAEMVAATRTVPIIFTLVTDPLASGFITSLAHPTGNVTGFTLVEDPAIAGKQLQLLKEIAPQVVRVLALVKADNQQTKAMRDAAAKAAPSIGVRLASAEIRHLADYTKEIEAFARMPNGGLLVIPNAIAVNHPQTVQALAAQYRLPAIYGFPFFARTGGLIAYGSDPVREFRAAARYVDRILRGAKPSDLPVQEPTKFELSINLKTAKALGLMVPPIVLAEADQVIE